MMMLALTITNPPEVDQSRSRSDYRTIDAENFSWVGHPPLGHARAQPLPIGATDGPAVPAPLMDVSEKNRPYTVTLDCRSALEHSTCRLTTRWPGIPNFCASLCSLKNIDRHPGSGKEKAMGDIFASLSVVAILAICLAVGVSNYRTSYGDDDDFADKAQESYFTGHKK